MTLFFANFDNYTVVWMWCRKENLQGVEKSHRSQGV